MELCSSSVKVEEVENTAGPNWLELPRDVTAKILNNLPCIDLLMSARHVCRLWWNICKDPFMWRSIHMSIRDPRPFHIWHLRDMCYLAIDQSRGHLQDINIEDFGSDNLLKYVANSTSQLRSLRFRNRNISDEALRDVADKLPLLEELEIAVSGLSLNTVEIIGRCCPHMTTLKLQLPREFSIKGNDDEAFAIAKNMPKLCHLELSGNLLTSYGLRAILEGCDHLESASLRDCYHVRLRESLGKSTCRLRRLRLANCPEISDVELMEFVTKLPLLEELVIFLREVSSNSLELIGRRCPYLTTLKFEYSLPFMQNDNDNDKAFVIAKAMPKLRHLVFYGNNLTNDGVLAILDGCNNLESLALAGCFDIDFKASLVKRCHQQHIKVVKLVDVYFEDDYYVDDPEVEYSVGNRDDEY